MSMVGVVVLCSGCFFCVENMAVKSISKGPASERCRFSSGKADDDGGFGDGGRLRSGTPAVTDCSDSRHSHLDPSVHPPQPIGVLTNSSAHEQGPLGAQVPQVRLLGSPRGSGGVISCAIEKGCGSTGLASVLELAFGVCAVEAPDSEEPSLFCSDSACIVIPRA